MQLPIKIYKPWISTGDITVFTGWRDDDVVLKEAKLLFFAGDLETASPVTGAFLLAVVDCGSWNFFPLPSWYDAAVELHFVGIIHIFFAACKIPTFTSSEKTITL